MTAATLADLCRPAYLWVPDGATFEAGDEAADMARQLGFQVDQPEVDALRTLLAESPDGKWAALESSVICGRQNLKTWALEMTVLYDAFLRDVKRVVWTSHRFKTTQQAFGDLVTVVENHDWLRKRVKKIRTANGEEGFELLSGTRIDFLARTSNGGRGLTGDTVILDEGLYVVMMMLGALLPTLSSRPNPAVRWGSSPGLRESESLRRIRDRGRPGGDPSLAYIEFTSPRGTCEDPVCSHEVGVAGCQLDDETKWAQANPALGRRIGVDYVRSERRALPPSEFMRERLGWWEDPPEQGDEQVIPAEAWLERLDQDSCVEPGSDVAFVIDTSWDRQTSWIGVAAMREDLVPHIEIVATNYGTEWIAGWLRERLPTWDPVAVGLQGSGAPVSSILEQLREEFGELIVGMSAQDLGRACGTIFDAVVNGPLAHTGQKQLDDAVKHAAIRPVGDSWLWDRKHSVIDIAPLVAVTGALYLLQTKKKPVKKRSRVVGW